MKNTIIFTGILLLSVFSINYANAAENPQQSINFAPQRTHKVDKTKFHHIFFGVDAVGYQHVLPAGTATKYVDGNCDSWDTDCMHSNVGFQLQAGYQFNRYLAVQTDYVYFDNETNNDQYSGNTALPDALHMNAIDLMAKGILPIGDKFSVYGEAGVAYVMESDYNVDNDWIFGGPATTRIDTHNAGFTPAVGAGISYYPIKWLSINAGIKYYAKTGPIDSFTMIPVGVGFHFA